jgi:hypothetical protein
MNEPNAALMKRYGTEDVFLQKTAGETPLLALLAAGLFNAGLARSNKKGDDKSQAEQALRNEAIREIEHMKLDQAERALKHTPVPEGRLSPKELRALDENAQFFESDPMFDKAGALDPSTLRLASIAIGIGEDIAKEAGIGLNAAPAAGNLLSSAKKLLSGGLGLKTNLALGATAVGGTILGSKAMHAGTRALAKEPSTPVYGMGAPSRGVGYQMPFGVNQYGQPQVGTPIG